MERDFTYTDPWTGVVLDFERNIKAAGMPDQCGIQECDGKYDPALQSVLLFHLSNHGVLNHLSFEKYTFLSVGDVKNNPWLSPHL